MNFNWVISLFRAVNKNWTSRVFSLVLIASLTYSATKIFAAKSGGKTCIDCERQRSELIQALIDIKRDLQPIQTTSFVETENSGIMFAVYDTAKPKKPAAKAPQQQQQEQIKKVVSKIDSLLLKYQVQQKQQI